MDIPDGARVTEYISQFPNKIRINIVLKDGTPKTIKVKNATREEDSEGPKETR